MNTDTIEQRSDLGDDKEVALFDYWQQQEQIAEKEERDWIKRARKIVKRYRDERGNNQGSLYRYNMFWSNVQTLEPALYGRTPKPDIDRRFKDADPVGRLAAILLERSCDFLLSGHEFDDVMEAVVSERLTVGRGVGRVMYIPTFTWDIEPTQGIDAETKPKKTRRLVSETAEIHHIYWEDYREGPARSWKQVPWVRYRAYLTRDQLTDRFGDKGKKVTLDYTPKGTGDETKETLPPDAYKKAEVHEIWDKEKLEVVWLAPGTKGVILDQLDDPLRLPGFFPNPNPVFATMTTDKRIPVPDYLEYQDQLREMDTLSARIDKLTKALKVAGVYPASEKQSLQQLVQEGTENKLIPVEDWAAFGEKIANGIIIWLPIEQIVKVVMALYEARDKSKQVLYEITGIADVIRGSTDPQETLGAQQMKGRFVTLRLSKQQKKVAKFSRDCIRLIAAVVATHFSKETISKITGYPQLQPMPPQPQGAAQAMNAGGVMAPNPALMQWQQQAAQVQAQNAMLTQQFEQAIELLRNDAAADFRIDIEADSTIVADEEAEKRSRVEFLEQLVPLLENVMPLATGNPPVAALAKEITLFAVRAFKSGRPLEEALEKAFDAIAQSKPPPNPAQEKAQVEQEKNQSALEIAKLKAQTDSADTMQKIGMAHEKNQVQVATEIANQGLERQRLAVEAENAETRREEFGNRDLVRLVR